MPKRRFLVDTGATRTTIPKTVLINALSYTEEDIERNRIFLPEDKKPKIFVDMYRFADYSVMHNNRSKFYVNFRCTQSALCSFDTGETF